MRPMGLGVAAALVLAILSPLGVAHAAPKSETPAISKDQRDKGMAAAPGLVSAGGFDCKVSDARLIGSGTDSKTKAKVTLYELACTGNEGLLIQKTGDAVAAFTCAQADEPGPDGKPSSNRCELPGNADPAAGLAPYVAKAGKSCTIAKMRALGQVADQCGLRGGLSGRLGLDPGDVRPAQSGQARLDGSLRRLSARWQHQLQADRHRRATGGRRPSDGQVRQGLHGQGPQVRRRDLLRIRFYEAACQEGKGYMIESAANGDFKEAIDCAAADSIAGGCTLTDARQAKTEQAGLYSKLAAKAGFQCQVSGYAPLPGPAGKDVVEMACSNRPDGAIGIFGASENDPATIIDCAHAELKGYRCALTKPSAAYATLTADLKALGKSSCQVSNARAVGVSADQHGYIEVACADGLAGYMIEYTLSPITPKTPLVCAEAKGISGGCTLPGNKK